MLKTSGSAPTHTAGARTGAKSGFSFKGRLVTFVGFILKFVINIVLSLFDFTVVLCCVVLCWV